MRYEKLGKNSGPRAFLPKISNLRVSLATIIAISSRLKDSSDGFDFESRAVSEWFYKNSEKFTVVDSAAVFCGYFGKLLSMD